jgi:Xaa-Pro aminopeptidase
MMRTAYVKGIANAQRVARAAVLCVAEGVKPGDSERQVCARLEHEFAKAGVLLLALRQLEGGCEQTLELYQR